VWVFGCELDMSLLVVDAVCAPASWFASPKLGKCGSDLWAYPDSIAEFCLLL
jgi:hypothetical protein